MGNSITKIKKARLKYEPERIKYLLIAEAPPNDVERFFYYEDVKEKDFLFLGVMEVLYPDLKSKYLLGMRDKQLKKEMLEQFKLDGFYLVDLSDKPLSTTIITKKMTKLFLAKLDELVDKETKIVLIKINIFEMLFPLINARFEDQVANYRLPFPSSGQQGRFRIMFNDVINNFLKFKYKEF